MSWYFKARELKHTESGIIDLATLGNRLQLQLKEAFQTEEAQACIIPISVSVELSIMDFTGLSLEWCIPKFDAIQHIPSLLAMYGCWENVSTQVVSF